MQKAGESSVLLPLATAAPRRKQAIICTSLVSLLLVTICVLYESNVHHLQYAALSMYRGGWPNPVSRGLVFHPDNLLRSKGPESEPSISSKHFFKREQKYLIQRTPVMSQAKAFHSHTHVELPPYSSPSPKDLLAKEVSRRGLFSAMGAAMVFGTVGQTEVDEDFFSRDEYLPALDDTSNTKFVKEVRAMVSPGDNNVIRSSYQPNFVVYLAGFLINYDSEFTKLWRRKGEGVRYWSSPLARSYYLQLRYRQLAQTLESEITKITARELTQYLWDKYTNKSIESLHQVRILFSFMGKDNQPQNLIATGLEMEVEKMGKTMDDIAYEHLYTIHAERLADLESEIVGLLENFEPPELLPIELCPVFDSSESCWVVPAPDHLAARNDGRPLVTKYTSKSFLQDQGPATATKQMGFNFPTWFILALAGGTAASLTHVLVQPVDVARTRKTMASRGSNSFWGTAGRIYIEDGRRLILLRNGCTVLGRFLHGCTIYPTFEMTKLFLATNLVGVVGFSKYHFPLVVVSSIAASLISVLNLTPFEALKAKTFANTNYCDSIWQGMSRLVKEEGVAGVYSNYTVLLYRVITFNVAEFFVFDYFNEVVVWLFPTIFPGTQVTRAGLSLLKGCLAGMLGVVVSQPIDTAISRARVPLRPPQNRSKSPSHEESIPVTPEIPQHTPDQSPHESLLHPHDLSPTYSTYESSGKTELTESIPLLHSHGREMEPAMAASGLHVESCPSNDTAMELTLPASSVSTTDGVESGVTLLEKEIGIQPTLSSESLHSDLEVESPLSNVTDMEPTLPAYSRGSISSTVDSEGSQSGVALLEKEMGLGKDSDLYPDLSSPSPATEFENESDGTHIIQMETSATVTHAVEETSLEIPSLKSPDISIQPTKRNTGIIAAAKEIFQESGIMGFYDGSGPRFLWAICVISGEFFLYDGIKEALVNLTIH